MSPEQPVHLLCPCALLHPQELLLAWRGRAAVTFKRMMLRSHRVNVAALNKTIDLIQRMERGDADCFSPDNAHHSHHLPDCPASIRNRGRKVVCRHPRRVVEDAQHPPALWRVA